MLNILVVDDEPKHRRGLSRMLKALKPDCNIYDARDGEEALQSVKAHPVDLIFTDIQMPIMNGLELVEQLNRRGGSESIIIMSAYPDFTYAQRALQLGASDYLLKPVEERKILPLLDKAESKAYGIRRDSLESALSECLKGEATDENIRLLEQAFPGFQRGYALAASLSIARGRDAIWTELQTRLTLPLKACGLSCAFCQSDNILMIFLVSDHASPVFSSELEARLRQVADEFAQADKGSLSFGLGGEFTDWTEGVRHACQRARHALKASFYHGCRVIYHPEQMAGGGHVTIQLDTGRLTRAVLDGDPKDARACIDTAIELTYTEGCPDPQQLKYAVAAAIHQLGSVFLESGLPVVHSADFEQILWQGQHVEALKQAARAWVFELMNRLKQRKPNRAEFIIGHCKTYIETYYHEPDLSLSTLSLKFHFNPSYFCLLFKTHTGTTIHQFIMQTRLKAASQRLLHTSDKVYTIAQQVGYKDVKYFTRLFKKQYGMSPEEFRHLSAIR
ncbi:response regulator transcription factor [Paenibacillus sanguinis]|uniref:response regulator transcription factor n=1 Tax=Paenibacillus sanguinis TaxID=225906 RepID=UPI0003633F60|nr:response regulator [Paenibacillus sanguinis]